MAKGKHFKRMCTLLTYIFDSYKVLKQLFKSFRKIRMGLGYYDRIYPKSKLKIQQSTMSITETIERN